MAEAEAPGGPAVAPLDAGHPRLVFTCANPHHGSDCTRCVPAPEDPEVEDFILVGDAGAKNGEKKLRSLLTSRPEWCDARQREILAQAAESAGESQSGLALALRTRNISLLRKRHLLHLARLLRLKSDLWQRKQRAAGGGAGGRRPPGEAPHSHHRTPPRRAGHPPSLGHLHVSAALGAGPFAGGWEASYNGASAPVGGSRGWGCPAAGDAPSPFVVAVTPASCDAYIASTLLPLCRRACQLMMGPRAAEAARSLGAPHITSAGSAMCRSASAMLANLAQAMQTDAQTLMLWHDAHARAGGHGPSQGGPPAWRVLAERIDIASKACLTVKGVVFAGFTTNRSDQESLVALHGPGQETVADQMWFAEINDCLCASLDMASRVDALLGQLLFADVGTYLCCAARLVSTVLASYLQGLSAAQVVRATWMDDVIRDRTATAVHAHGAPPALVRAQEAQAAARSAQAHQSGFAAMVGAAAVLGDLRDMDRRGDPAEQSSQES